MDELKKQFELLLENFNTLKAKQAQQQEGAIKNLNTFAEFIEDLGQELASLKLIIDASNLQGKLSNANNPSSDFFKYNLYTSLNASFNNRFKEMVTTAFGNSKIPNSTGSIGTNDTDKTVTDILTAVNSILDAPAIGDAIDATGYGAIVKEGFGIASSLIVSISAGVKQGKKKKLLTEFYALLPDVKKSITKDIEPYITFYSGLAKSNYKHTNSLATISLGCETLAAQIISLSSSLINALKDNGINVVEINRESSLNNIVTEVRSILESALEELEKKPDLLFQIDALIKSQSLSLYQQFIGYHEERLRVENELLKEYSALFNSVESLINRAQKDSIETSGKELLDQYLDQQNNLKKTFDKLIKDLYF